LRNGSLFRLRTDVGDIDLFAEITGLGTYDEVKTCALDVEAYQRRLWTLDLRGLIKAKRASGRPQDLNDLAELDAAGPF